MTKVCPTKIRIHVMESEEEEKNFFKKIRMGIGIDDDSPIELEDILKADCLTRAVECLRVLPEDYAPKVRLFNCDMAESVLPIWKSQYPDDKSAEKAIEMSRLFALGKITKVELKQAHKMALAVESRVHLARKILYCSDYPKDLNALAAAIAAAHESDWDYWDAVWHQSFEVMRSAQRARGEHCFGEDSEENTIGEEEKYQTKLFLKYFGKDQP